VAVEWWWSGGGGSSIGSSFAAISLSLTCQSWPFFSTRLRITCIEESPNPPQFMSTALGSAHKGVAMAALNIINDRSESEEGVDGCGPILSKSFC
jgi:hypothetical protein